MEKAVFYGKDSSLFIKIRRAEMRREDEDEDKDVVIESQQQQEEREQERGAPPSAPTPLSVCMFYQTIGIGLWDAVLHDCYKHNVAMMDIWVLERARSGEFYASKGCKCVKKGDYYVGSHKEIALCYRWERQA